MNTIGALLTRDLDRKIEEIIQVDQADEQSVYEEITEYIATDSIRDQYAQLLEAIAEAPAEPHEGIGVWISGFFGSGKSSFAKNLGYALKNEKIRGTGFAELFKQQIDDERVNNFLDSITARVPTEVMLFEVAKERDTRKVTERIAELMYTVLLRELDYAEDFDIAELEIELEAEGKLDEFIETCRKLHSQEWQRVRKGAQKLSRASAVLHAIDPNTYTSADSWSHAQRNRDTTITVSKVVERTFELVGRRRPGKALVFIIDEVGQHVARSGDKIEDLRATIEEFGKVGKNLMTARKIIAPCWIVVTSQEKLDDVVAAIDSKRVELAKLQDRFRYRVDLAPSDIREVATKRVLAKKREAEPILKKLFADNQGALNAALRLERTSRRTTLSENDFVQFYPYPPHYIDLCIGIMSGIRLQPGAPRQYGGSNRTIIKQAYEMLVSDRTALAQKPIGTLVTLDKVFELVEGNLSNERRTDIYEISEQCKGDPQDHGWMLRVAKVICLLEFIRDLPRTEANIAAFLVDAVGKPAPVAEVEEAVQKLYSAQFIRNTEDGWKLQTAQEKSWETERRGHLEPRPRDRNELIRQTLRVIYGEAALRTYRYRDFRSFRVGLRVNGAEIGDEGDLPLSLCIADDAEEMSKRLAEVREESRQPSHKNDVYWIFALTPEIDHLVGQLYASCKMVEKYDQLRAQNKITTEEATCLQDEKNAVITYQSRLQDKLTQVMEKGTGLFQGVAREAASLGKNLSEILKTLFGHVVPDLYPKLAMGARPLKGDEAESLLKAADLKVLPQVFYAGDNGLGLVVQDGPKLVLNTAADVAKEVFDYLVNEHNYGNKDTRTGRALERRFSGIGYGWDRDMLRLVLAVLFRAGSIEVTYQGSRFRNYQDPLSRVPFTNMEPAIPNKLRNTVTQCRKLLEESIAQTFQGHFGIYRGNKDEVHVEDASRMTHLSAEDQAYRGDILDALEHIKALGCKPKEALDQLTREIAFTHLNRLCAYKMMETRQAWIGGQRFREAVSRGQKSQGFMFYLADHPEDEQLFRTGQQEVAYRHFLDWLGTTLSREIGVLFSPNDPANRLYPPQRVLDAVLALINSEELVGIWTEDETIGWVYQYFTPKALRDQARKKSQAPRNSYELAFRNQFFTPRYVVEFLTDNTLGRIWYEMRQGDTKLGEQCRYMVRRPNEVFLRERESAPQSGDEGTDGLSQEELLKQPYYFPYRPKKDPRELKILDPACGSGHFLSYCFDVLQTIYEEAYDDPNIGPSLKKDYPTLDAMRRDVPGLILRCNLYGIDIDSRASQIAALTLWLRAQRAYQTMDFKADHPIIAQTNIVCAEPMPGERALLDEFVTRLYPPLLGQLVRVVFDRMQLAGEAGSLLRIEADIADAIAEAKKQWLTRPKAEQLTLWPEDKRPTVEQLGLFDVSGITDEEFWHQAEARVLDALQTYARHAADGTGLQRQLFADDAARGFAFVDVCRQQFDVVLMNPPFGEASKPSKVFIETAYPRTKNDVYAAFVERGLQLLYADGMLGAITSRTGFFLSSFQKWREEILLKEAWPTVFADLGYGVLDTAMVETAAYCLSKAAPAG